MEGCVFRAIVVGGWPGCFGSRGAGRVNLVHATGVAGARYGWAVG